MVALFWHEYSGKMKAHLLSGNDPLCSLKSRESDKAAEASAFEFRRLFQQPAFFLGVVGKHFRSKWGLAGAPRRNVIPFGHHNLCYYHARQYCHCDFTEMEFD